MEMLLGDSGKLQVILIFLGGFITELLFVLIRKKKFLPALYLFIVFCLLLTLPVAAVIGAVPVGDMIPSTNIFILTLLFVCFLFILVSVITFKEYLLFQITEFHLLCWLLIFAYLLLTRVGIMSWEVIFLIPCIISLIIIFGRFRVHPLWRMFLYIWYLIMMIVVSLFHIPSSVLFEYFVGGVPVHSLWALYFEGIFAFYLFSRLLLAVTVLPFPRIGYSFQESVYFSLHHIVLLGSFYHPLQFPFFWLCLYALVVSGLLLGNAQWQFVSDTALIFNVFLCTTYIYPIMEESVTIKRINALR